jgi:hypothetical protein
MALAEKHIADLIVELEGQQHVGGLYVDLTDVLPVLHQALAALQTSRGQMARMAELVEALSVAS